MRGEKSEVPEIETVTKTRRVSTGLILDNQGTVQFHFVTTWWARGVILGFVLMLTIIVIMIGLILSNKKQLDSLEQHVERKTESEVNH